MLYVLAAFAALALLIVWLRACVRDGRRHRELEFSVDPWGGNRTKPQAATVSASAKLDRS